jgi:hypothetical protein
LHFSFFVFFLFFWSNMLSPAVREAVRDFVVTGSKDANPANSEIETEIRVSLSPAQYKSLRSGLQREFVKVPTQQTQQTKVVHFPGNRRLLCTDTGEMSAEVKTILSSRVLPLKAKGFRAVIVRSMEQSLSDEETTQLFNAVGNEVDAVGKNQISFPSSFKSVRFLGHFNAPELTAVGYTQIQQFVESNPEQLQWLPLPFQNETSPERTFTNRAATLDISGQRVPVPAGSVVLVQETTPSNPAKPTKLAKPERPLLIRWRTRSSFVNAGESKSKVRIDLNQTQEVQPLTGQTRRLYTVEIELLSSVAEDRTSTAALLLGLERVFSVL